LNLAEFPFIGFSIEVTHYDCTSFSFRIRKFLTQPAGRFFAIDLWKRSLTKHAAFPMIHRYEQLLLRGGHSGGRKQYTGPGKCHWALNSHPFQAGKYRGSRKYAETRLIFLPRRLPKP
jgi:hypothetical protein